MKSKVVRNLATVILLSQNVQNLASNYRREHLAERAVWTAEAIVTADPDDAVAVTLAFSSLAGSILNQLDESTIAHWVGKSIEYDDAHSFQEWYGEIDKFIRSDALAITDENKKDGRSQTDDANAVNGSEENIGITPAKVDGSSEVSDQKKTDDEQKSDGASQPQQNTTDDAPLKDVKLEDLALPKTIRDILLSTEPPLDTAFKIEAYDREKGLISLPKYGEVARTKTLEAIAKARG